MRFSLLFLVGAYADMREELRAVCNGGQRAVTAIEKPLRKLFANKDYMAMEFKDSAAIGYELMSRVQPAKTCRNVLGKIETIMSNEGLESMSEEKQWKYFVTRYFRMGLTIFKNNVPDQLYKTVTNMMFAFIENIDSMSRDDIMDIYSMFADDETAKEVAEGIKWFLPDLTKKNMEQMQAIAVTDSPPGLEECSSQIEEIQQMFAPAKPHIKKVLDVVKSATSDKRNKHLASIGRTVQNVFNLAYAVYTNPRCDQNLENMMTYAMELFEEMEKEMGGFFHKCDYDCDDHDDDDHDGQGHGNQTEDGQGYEEYARSAINSLGTQLGRKGGMNEITTEVQKVHKNVMSKINKMLRALVGKDKAGKKALHFLMKQNHMMTMISAKVIKLHAKDMMREVVKMTTDDDAEALQAIEEIDFEAMGKSLEVSADESLSDFEEEVVCEGEVGGCEVLDEIVSELDEESGASSASAISAGFALTFALLTAR